MTHVYFVYQLRESRTGKFVVMVTLLEYSSCLFRAIEAWMDDGAASRTVLHTYVILILSQIKCNFLPTESFQQWFWCSPQNTTPAYCRGKSQTDLIDPVFFALNKHSRLPDILLYRMVHPLCAVCWKRCVLWSQIERRDLECFTRHMFIVTQKHSFMFHCFTVTLLDSL